MNQSKEGSQICFLCEESKFKFSHKYTEVICEDCLFFKKFSRIEGVIGNKRRLKIRNTDNKNDSTKNASPRRTKVIVSKRPKFKKSSQRYKKTHGKEKESYKKLDTEMIDDKFDVELETISMDKDIGVCDSNRLFVVIPLAWEPDKFKEGFRICRTSRIPFVSENVNLSESFASESLQDLQIDCVKLHKRKVYIHEPSTSQPRHQNLKRSNSAFSDDSNRKKSDIRHVATGLNKLNLSDSSSFKSTDVPD